MSGAPGSTEGGAAAEELDVEDPGLQDLARRMTEAALRGESAGPDDAAPADDSGAAGASSEEAVQSGTGQAAAGASGGQANAADLELQMLQVSISMHGLPAKRHLLCNGSVSSEVPW